MPEALSAGEILTDRPFADDSVVSEKAIDVERIQRLTSSADPETAIAHVHDAEPRLALNTGAARS